MADENEKPVPRDVLGNELKAGDQVIWRELPHYEVCNVYLGCYGGRAVIAPLANPAMHWGVDTRELELVPPQLDVAPPPVIEFDATASEELDVDAEGKLVVMLTGGELPAADHSGEITGGALPRLGAAHPPINDDESEAKE